ncbi:histone-lysine N-methyltransferase SETMAR [Trichonephila clavipes]|nr:histone-lysine N-methyltransferase SETMAR [Trichonephila clavipes]
MVEISVALRFTTEKMPRRRIRAHYEHLSEFERGRIIGLKEAVFSDESRFELCPDDNRVSGDAQGSVPILLYLLHTTQALNQELWSGMRFVLTAEALKSSLEAHLQHSSENESQTAEIVNDVYGADTVLANCVQFWFRRFPSDIFDVTDALSTGRPDVENVDKITEIIEVDRHVSSRSIAQELKIDHKKQF